MERVFQYRPSEVSPSQQDVFRALGKRGSQPVSERVAAVFQQASQLFVKLAAPQGVVQEITKRDFRKRFQSTLQPQSQSPLQQVIDRSRRLVLAVFTLGRDVGEKTQQLFGHNEPALAVMLDAIGSCSTELAVQQLQVGLAARASDQNTSALMYSPGYCGWPLEAQQALFALVQPVEIEVQLTMQLLMVPTKSVSGVIVLGDAHTHQFATDFACCQACQAKSCRDRRKGPKLPGTGPRWRSDEHAIDE